MSKTFYLKLALTNIKNNSKVYIPYLLATIGAIIMFCTLSFLSENVSIMENGDASSLAIIMKLGTIVIGILSVILLFYINSFMIKRRKKEIGLFNILGMEKKHIGIMLLNEMLISCVGTLIVGILCSVLFNKLMFLFLLDMLKLPVSREIGFSPNSIIITIILFTVVSFVAFIFNLLQVHVSSPIALLRGSNVGEKEPKSNVAIAIIGIISLGTGYFIALTVKNPLAALPLFLVAVILVIVGTYALFTAGSIALLKLLRRNKKFYYRTANFTSISGMIYRMKQNAAGLAGICILSTAVLVMISTTASLYIGMEDVLDTRYGKNFNIEAYNITPQKAAQIDNIVSINAEKYDVEILDNGKFRGERYTGTIKKNAAEMESVVVTVIPFAELWRFDKTQESVSKDEVLVYSLLPYEFDETLMLFDKEMQIKEVLTTFPMEKYYNNMGAVYNTIFVIVPDEFDFVSIYNQYVKRNSAIKGYSMYQSFDLKGENVLEFSTSTKRELTELSGVIIESKETSRQSFLSLYGSLLFLGIFLGVTFFGATALIIYYKQVSEGYNDRERFEIMQKVGMSKAEVKKCIKSQILQVFFLPLLVAVVHLLVAFPVLTILLGILNLTNVPLFIGCTVITIIVFAIIYSVVYLATARTYYKIVNN